MRNWETARHEILSPAQLRDLPRVHLEHDPPKAWPNEAEHPVHDGLLGDGPCLIWLPFTAARGGEPERERSRRFRTSHDRRGHSSRSVELRPVAASPPARLSPSNLLGHERGVTKGSGVPGDVIAA